MKKNLENRIKESLKNFEAPYNPKAWTSLNAKLDVINPSGGVSGSFKWIAAASAIIIASFATYYLAKKNTPQKTIIQATNSKLDNKTTEQTIDVNKEASLKTQLKEKLENKVEGFVSTKSNNSHTQVNSTKLEATEQSAIMNSVSSSSQTYKLNNVQHVEDRSQNESEVTINDKKTADSPSTPIQLPKLNTVCLNEVFTIKNTNDVAIIVYGPRFSQTIQAHTSKTLQAKIDGRYIIATNNISESPSTTFDVQPLPKAEFTIDTDNKFKNGLPTTSLSSSSGIDLTWEINGITFRGSTVDAHFYDKGVQTIKLTSVGTNGCVNSVEKEIFNDEKYNLLAVNSFIPNHTDPRLNTFMPFALTERNVNFSLIIIDPVDGHVLYQTNDSTMGWDGTDGKTGQQVKYENTYIWKVYLSNPEQGENSEYAGNIIPITK